MSVLDSLLVALGYEFDDEELKSFENSLDSVTNGINTLTLAAAGMVTMFAGATVASAAATDELTKQARRINITAAELDAYNFAAEQTIGTNSGVAESLRQLYIRASEAARGTGSAVEAFGILGISVTDSNGRLKDVNMLLGESADALNRLSSEGQRLELADKLGLSQLDLLLRNGSAGISALTQEAMALGTVVDADGVAAENFNDQVNRLKRVLTATVRFVSTEVLPVFTDIAESMQMWVQENRELIRSRLVQFLNLVTMALRNFQLILIGIISLKFTVFLLRMVAAYKALGAAALLANIKMAAIVIAIAAIIAAIGLLIEDFIVWRRGGESAIGALLAKFPLLNSAVESLGAAMASARSWLTDFFEIFFDYLEQARTFTTDFFEIFFGYLDKLRLNTTDAFEAIGDAINSVIEGFGRAQRAVTSFFDKVGSTYNRVKGLLDAARSFLGEDDTVATVNAVSASISAQPGLAFPEGAGILPAGIVPRAPQLFASSAAPSQVVRQEIKNQNDTTININGGDIARVRQTVEDVINGKIEQASNNAQSPVAS